MLRRPLVIVVNYDCLVKNRIRRRGCRQCTREYLERCCREALLQILQSVQNQKPNVKGIMSIVKHEPESIHWMNASCLLCLIKYVVSSNRNQCETKMRELPPALQSKLLTYVMYELPPTTKDSRGKTVSSYPTLRDLVP